MVTQTLLIIAFILGAIVVVLVTKIVVALLPLILLSLPSWSDLIFNHYDVLLNALSGSKDDLKLLCVYANPVLYWDKYSLVNPLGSFIMLFAYISFVAYIFKQKLGVWCLSWFLASVLVWFSGGTLQTLSETLGINSLLILLVFNIPSIMFLLMRK